MQVSGEQRNEPERDALARDPLRSSRDPSAHPHRQGDSPRLGAQRMGWHIVFHPGFSEPLLRLASTVERQRREGILDLENSPGAKLLKRILDLILIEIPTFPGAAQYEQGNTLGADARGWRRAKFLGRFRLFFRFDTASKVIVYAWVNDENTLRKAGASSDPYTVFRKMLIDGNPPHDWNKLLDACRKSGDDRQSLAGLVGNLSPVPEPPQQPPKAKKRRGQT
jgi:toxin YhaV